MTSDDLRSNARAEWVKAAHYAGKARAAWVADNKPLSNHFTLMSWKHIDSASQLERAVMWADQYGAK